MNRYHWTPDTWVNFSTREKSLVIAGIEHVLAEEKKQMDEINQ